MSIEILLALNTVLVLGLYFKNRSITPTIQKKKDTLLDTCAIIDGRIIELARSGFIRDRLIVPVFVLSELQGLADGGDAHKRARARFGLDIIKQLQDMEDCDIIIDKTATSAVEVDEKLVELASRYGAKLFTTDYNLNKVASVRGVKVLNINELAQSLRPVVLPGEKTEVKIIQRGENRSQGVGYLEDGTMVVIDNAAKYIGKVMEIEVDRTFQTVAGKMLFAHLAKRN